MPFTKVWGTTGTNLGTATLWEPISLRSAAYAWTASGSGTNEYYLRTAANGNPGFAAQPNNLYINGANATEGTAGSLTAGQWDYADNDTLGYSTIYVRLSDGTDPDTKTNGYASKREAKRAADLRALEHRGLIRNLREQVKYLLIPAAKDAEGKTIERACSIVLDFVYEEAPTWNPVHEDCKGFRTEVYRIKRKLFYFVYGYCIRET